MAIITMSMCDDCNIGNHAACPRHLGEAGCTCQCLKPRSTTAVLVQPKHPTEEVRDLLGIININGFITQLTEGRADEFVEAGIVSRWEANQLLNIRAQSASNSGWRVSTKQLYTLRDIKDKLIEKGVI